MEHKPPLQYGGVYHIYNRGINKAPLFLEEEDFRHFIDLIRTYTCAVADTYSYAVMRNHFHLAVRIKQVEEIGYLLLANNVRDITQKWKVFWPHASDIEKQHLRKPEPEKMFSHALNAYAKWYNHKYGRSGRLFEARFERNLIDSEDRLRRLIVYINSNPEHHKVVSSYIKYPWISYHELTSTVDSWLSSVFVIGLFNDLPTFIAAMTKIEFDDWLTADF